MGAVRMVAACEIRRRWRSVTVLTLLVGIVGAVVLATAAGARRTNSALVRFNAYSRSGDLELTVGDPTPEQLRAFQELDGVRAFAPLRAGALMIARAPDLQAIAGALDARFGSVVDRARVVTGRVADPSAADEITIGETLAAQLHIRVGDRLEAQSFTPEQVARYLAGANGGAPAGPGLQLRVVGIVRRPLDLGDRGAAGGVLVLTPEFTREYATRIGSFNGTLLRVRTRNPATDVPRVAAAARRIFGRSQSFSVQDLAIESEGARNAIEVLTVALWVFAGVAALAGIVAVSIILGREVSLTAVDQATQTALGLTRRQHIGVSALRALPVALGGALVAGLGAAGASGLFPVGVARRAEPNLGFRIDWMVQAVGVIAVGGGILLIACVAAVWMTHRQTVGDEGSGRGQTSAVIEAAARAGVSPVATTGVRMAVEPGRGPTAVPVRSAFVGAIFGVLGMVVVFMFASSLDHLVATPRLYGWTWDFAAVVDDVNVLDPGSPVVRERGLAAVTALNTDNVQLDGRPVIVWGFTSLRGAIRPEIVAGRAPRARDEIALGAVSLQTLGKRIGQTVQGEGAGGAHSYRIVGRVVFPKLNGPQPISNGAMLTGGGLAQLRGGASSNGTGYLLARLAPRVDRGAVEHRIGSVAGVERPFGPSVPVEVDRLRQIDWLPATLVGLLLLLAPLAVGHALVTSVRRRRRDLALLKALGFDRLQVRAIVAWQATTLAVVGLAVGIPAGLLVGGVVWRLVANGLGVSTTPVVPALTLLLIAPGALALLNVIAFLPARGAAQTRPAVALRTE